MDSTCPRVSAEFWRSLLGLVYRRGHERPARGDDDPAGRDWLNLETSTGEARLAIQYVEDLPRSSWPTSVIPQQLHLDLTVGSVEELNDVRSRIVLLGGAVRFDRSDDVNEPLYVFADPDGHPFCVFVA